MIESRIGPRGWVWADSSEADKYLLASEVPKHVRRDIFARSREQHDSAKLFILQYWYNLEHLHIDECSGA